MWKNYLVVALRNLRRRRAFAFLNVFGLATGIMCCLFILVYVRHERSYDRFHENFDRLYRVVNHFQSVDEDSWSPWLSGAAGPAFEAEVPEVEAAIRVMNMRSDRLLRYEEQVFWEHDLLEVDASFLTAFSFRLLKGDPETALAAPFSIVLTESTARKYFGSENPVGKNILSNNERELTVTGIMEDVPGNSHLQFDGLISISTWTTEVPEAVGAWNWSNLMTYVLLQSGSDPATVGNKLNEVIERHYGEALAASSNRMTMHLEPVLDIHLESTYGGIGAMRAGYNVRLFSLIAVFVVLMASINFMNLATSRSTERAREIGVRKCMGAQRSSIVFQFLTEAVLLSLLALGFAVLLVWIFHTPFEKLSGIVPSWSVSFSELLVLVAGAVVVGLIGGIYPAAILSGFRPARVLKGSLKTSGQGRLLRKGLVSFQMALAVGLIAATGVVLLQVRYMQGREPGFDMNREGELLVVDLPADGSLVKSIETVRERLAAIQGVAGVTVSSNTPASGGRRAVGGSIQLDDGTTKNIKPVSFAVDPDFFTVYGLEVVAGRVFTRDRATDDEAFILNEAAVIQCGFNSPEAIIGKPISLWKGNGMVTGPVIGVVRDFNIAGLQERVPEMVLWRDPMAAHSLTLRIQHGNVQETMASIESAWKELAPSWPFTYHFLDDQFDLLYRSEVRFGRIFLTFAILAIIIACLGLYGLASFTAIQRTKEIGVRKVLGATTPNILALLSKEYVQYVVTGIVIAVPITYYGMLTWLNEFAYRVNLGPWIFVMAGVVVCAITVLTVGLHSLPAALANPTDSLRYE